MQTLQLNVLLTSVELHSIKLYGVFDGINYD